MMGMVHIYTGDGKGKTTAAVGLCTRAAGHGKKAAFYEFLKGAKTGEAKSLAALGVEFYCPVEREKFTWTMTETEKAEGRASLYHLHPPARGLPEAEYDAQTDHGHCPAAL